ncbi:hypothetical protein [Alteribacter natronophilus]|nr:hypothetical protein [Alteribacter natronophilus]
MKRLIAAGAGIGLTVYAAGLLMDYRERMKIDEERRLHADRKKR